MKEPHLFRKTATIYPKPLLIDQRDQLMVGLLKEHFPDIEDNICAIGEKTVRYNGLVGKEGIYSVKLHTQDPYEFKYYKYPSKQLVDVRLENSQFEDIYLSSFYDEHEGGVFGLYIQIYFATSPNDTLKKVIELLTHIRSGNWLLWEERSKVLVSENDERTTPSWCGTGYAGAYALVYNFFLRNTLVKVFNDRKKEASLAISMYDLAKKLNLLEIQRDNEGVGVRTNSVLGEYIVECLDSEEIEKYKKGSRFQNSTLFDLNLREHYPYTMVFGVRTYRREVS